MKLTKLHLIIILALALILCPILGVCSNMREGYENGVGVGDGVGGDDVHVTEGMGEGDDEGDDEVEGDYDETNFASG
jgi:hypothetical protein